MRNRYRLPISRMRGLLAGTDRRKEMDPITPEIEQIVQASFPPPAPSEALRSRVAGICRAATQGASDAGPGGRAFPRERVSLAGRRLGWGIAMLALLAVLWTSSRYGSDPVAAAI